MWTFCVVLIPFFVLPQQKCSPAIFQMHQERPFKVGVNWYSRKQPSKMIASYFKLKVDFMFGCTNHNNDKVKSHSICWGKSIRAKKNNQNKKWKKYVFSSRNFLHWNRTRSGAIIFISVCFQKKDQMVMMEEVQLLYSNKSSQCCFCIMILFINCTFTIILNKNTLYTHAHTHTQLLIAMQASRQKEQTAM